MCAFPYSYACFHPATHKYSSWELGTCCALLPGKGQILAYRDLISPTGFLFPTMEHCDTYYTIGHVDYMWNYLKYYDFLSIILNQHTKKYIWWDFVWNNRENILLALKYMNSVSWFYSKHLFLRKFHHLYVLICWL